MVVWLFLAVPWVCLQFVIVAFPDHTHLIVLGSEYPLYIIYMNHTTGDLETWFASLDSKWVYEYELEMPLTRSHTVLEFDHEII